ncbi:TPA: hypothetical protein ACH3X1_003270 [Trebouxia sp. C0004]
MSILVKAKYPHLSILDLSHNRLDLPAMHYFITGKWSFCGCEPQPAQLSCHQTSDSGSIQVPGKAGCELPERDAGGIAALGQANWRQLKHLRVSIRVSQQDASRMPGCAANLSQG